MKYIVLYVTDMHCMQLIATILKIMATIEDFIENSTEIKRSLFIVKIDRILCSPSSNIQQIKLPTFDGVPKNWIKFKDIYLIGYQTCKNFIICRQR